MCIRTAELESETPVAWTLDGENGGNHTKVVIRNLRREVEIRVGETGGKQLLGEK